MHGSKSYIDEVMKAGNGAVKIFDDKALKAHIKNIRCPLHHKVIPGKLAFLIEPNPLAKDFSDDLCERFKLKKWKWKRDAYGRKIPDYRNHYQPEISAAYAKEKIYTPLNPTCLKCRRCHQ